MFFFAIFSKIQRQTRVKKDRIKDTATKIPISFRTWEGPLSSSTEIKLVLKMAWCKTSMY